MDTSNDTMTLGHDPAPKPRPESDLGADENETPNQDITMPEPNNPRSSQPPSTTEVHVLNPRRQSERAVKRPRHFLSEIGEEETKKRGQLYNRRRGANYRFNKHYGPAEESQNELKSRNLPEQGLKEDFQQDGLAVCSNASNRSRSASQPSRKKVRFASMPPNSGPTHERPNPDVSSPATEEQTMAEALASLSRILSGTWQSAQRPESPVLTSNNVIIRHQDLEMPPASTTAAANVNSHQSQAGDTSLNQTGPPDLRRDSIPLAIQQQYPVLTSLTTSRSLMANFVAERRGLHNLLENTVALDDTVQTPQTVSPTPPFDPGAPVTGEDEKLAQLEAEIRKWAEEDMTRWKLSAEAVEGTVDRSDEKQHKE